MAKLIFVRHAESVHNATGNISSALPGAGLSAKGVQQASDLAGAIADRPIKAVFASPARRAMETAERIAERQMISVQTDQRLVEIGVGVVEGMTEKEGMALLDCGWESWLDRGMLDAPLARGGETGLDAIRRFSSFVEDVSRAAAPDALFVVVSHGGLLQLCLPHLSVNLEASHGRDNWLRNTQTVEVEFTAGQLRCNMWADSVCDPGLPSHAFSLQEVSLTGGGTNAVARRGSQVLRPTHPWSPAIHVLLRHLEEVGFDRAPKFHGVDASRREVLDYMPGEVGNYPLSEDVKSVDALESAAALLRSYHDATISLAESSVVTNLPWMFPAKDPMEVICHSDFAPYNCSFEQREAIGIIDFDTAHPGPRSWDIAYALYRFCPLAGPSNSDGFGDRSQQARRADAFLDAYGADSSLRVQAVDSVVPRLRSLVDFMERSADEGDAQAKEHIQSGHLSLYLDDIAYINRNLSFFRAAVMR